MVTFITLSGYKMCGRMYLNGEGVGEGTHMSLFFVVMKGNCDPVLKWPFRQKVTMMVIDQDGSQDIVDVIQPDPNSPSFM